MQERHNEATIGGWARRSAPTGLVASACSQHTQSLLCFAKSSGPEAQETIYTKSAFVYRLDELFVCIYIIEQ
jgi:hypothetical protein